MMQLKIWHYAIVYINIGVYYNVGIVYVYGTDTVVYNSMISQHNDTMWGVAKSSKLSQNTQRDMKFVCE